MKKQLKNLNKPLTDNQFIRELDKLKIPRLVKKAMYAQRKAGGVAWTIQAIQTTAIQNNHAHFLPIAPTSAKQSRHDLTMLRLMAKST